MYKGREMHTTTISPTEKDARLARKISEQIDSLSFPEGSTRLHVDMKNEDDLELFLTSPLVRLLQEALKEMGKGNSLTISIAHKEVTTQQAADMLNVSRPFLIQELLDTGKIPHHKVGNRRRIRMQDVIEYRDAEDIELARRKQVMLELIAETESLGLYK